MRREVLPLHQPDGTTSEPCRIVSSEPYTPRRVVIDDLEIIVRDLRDDEASMAYTWYRQRAESGQGYSLGEIGNFSDFRKRLLYHQTAVVLEDSVSHDIIYVALIRAEAKLKRHSRQRIANTASLVLNPATVGNNSHSVAQTILFETLTNFAIQQGYRYALTWTPLSNHNVLRMITKIPTTILGTIPDGIFLQGHGFTDIVIYRHEYQSHKNTRESKIQCFLIHLSCSFQL